jgi:hypothetical protein
MPVLNTITIWCDATPGHVSHRARLVSSEGAEVSHDTKLTSSTMRQIDFAVQLKHTLKWHFV